MSSFNESLSQSQQSYLSEHFFVYDPIKQSCHQDFSGLLGSRVVVIGEIHHSARLEQAQSKILSWFGGISATLCLEGVPYGMRLPAKEMPQWKGLPGSFTLLGADLRVKSERALVSQYYELRSAQQDLGQKEQERGLATGKKLAQLVNSELESGAAGLKEGNLFAKPELIKEIDALLANVGDGLAKLDAIDQKLGKWKAKEGQTVELCRSNEGLSQTVFSVLDQGQRAFAIWGNAHLWSNPSLFRKLRLRHVPFTVLVPSKKQMKLCCSDLRWMYQSPKFMEVNITCVLQRLPMLINGRRAVQSKTVKTSYTWPKEFVPFFDQRIQPLFHRELPKAPIARVSEEYLLQLASQNSRINFAKNQVFSFSGLNPKLLAEIYDFFGSDNKVRGFSGGEKTALYRLIWNAFEQSLFWAKRRIVSLTILGDQAIEVSRKMMVPELRLSSTEVFSFELSSEGPLTIPIQDFLWEMERRELKTYTVPVSMSLFLHGVSEEELEELFKGGNLASQLIQLLERYAPPNRKVKLGVSERLSISKSTVAFNDGSKKLRGVRLVSSAPFQVILEL